ncbi:DUF2752 domain-containing protein [Urbifossiella limnaea]|uniref:DUF2752 domain-containing protein n=1 Tax=Urbifossiella limnaea TaxID=2528023 RepID=A0A517XVL8_9BACT|nr:DUF2752 domain-containing protein [Urbifossiella limnaea]QDU21524.1 hypothetical protein ETAA1_34910 [Urbifossiella limnaea]
MTAPPPDRRTRTAVRGALVGIAVLALGGVVSLIATTPPTPDSFYPKCTLYQATGLHCPGCGAGRAAHAALNGRVAQAFAYNPVAVLLLPVVVVVALVQTVQWARGRPTRTRIIVSGRWIMALAVALIVFMLLRNLPWYPFTLLAPHDL